MKIIVVDTNRHLHIDDFFARILFWLLLKYGVFLSENDDIDESVKVIELEICRWFSCFVISLLASLRPSIAFDASTTGDPYIYSRSENHSIFQS